MIMNDNDNEEAGIEDELTSLKQRADQMGITYSPNIGVATLRERVNAALNDEPNDGADEQDSGGKEEDIQLDPAVMDKNMDPGKAAAFAAFEAERRANNKQSGTKAPKLTKSQLTRMYHTRLRKEANKLVRCRITCMNPNKKNWTGEILSVSNRVIGTIKKFVPYNSEEPYHVPAALLRLLKEREYSHRASIKLPNGRESQNSTRHKEFAIEVLPNLTKDELKELANRQAMSRA